MQLGHSKIKGAFWWWYYSPYLENTHLLILTCTKINGYGFQLLQETSQRNQPTGFAEAKILHLIKTLPEAKSGNLICMRLKIHLWRIAANCLPTKELLSKYVNLGDTSCSLCKADVESCLHLFALCTFIKAIWYNSQWGPTMDNMGLTSPPHLIRLLISPPFDDKQEEFLLFGAIVCDLIRSTETRFILRVVPRTLIICLQRFPFFWKIMGVQDPPSPATLVLAHLQGGLTNL